jgi:uncharacterized protein YbjQ (UPF0145 family)
LSISHVVDNSLCRTIYHVTTKVVNFSGVKEYLGIVTGEAVVGANLFRDLFAGIRDIVGGRAGAYEKELRKARDLAFEETTEVAQELGVVTGLLHIPVPAQSLDGRVR